MDMARLPRAAELARLGARNPRWRPGLGTAFYSEIFAASREGSGAGAALALAGDGMRQLRRDAAEEKAILWVQDKEAIRRSGRPYRPGLPRHLRDRLIHVAAQSAADALFALEEGLRCRDLACVIGELAGNPRQLDFTASRRLSLATEKHGVPLFLVRLDAHPELSAARMRWQIAAAPSAPPLWNRNAPGRTTWRAELFRARAHPPGEWILRDDDPVLAAESPMAANPAAAAPDHGDLVRATGA